MKATSDPGGDGRRYRETHFVAGSSSIAATIAGSLRGGRMPEQIRLKGCRNDACISVTPRQRLLEEVTRFVIAVGQLGGVQRISLIGSLATDKREPKDADLLVVVEDHADLPPLARLSRRLQGRLQSHNLGSDVFLVNPLGKYLGRVCSWRLCEPGVRRSCRALHCGRRRYLYDDLDTLQLPGQVVAEPPAELWPDVCARQPVPDDVQQMLIQLRR